MSDFFVVSIKIAFHPKLDLYSVGYSTGQKKEYIREPAVTLSPSIQTRF